MQCGVVHALVPQTQLVWASLTIALARPVPALQKQPQREPDSSDEEEERALALGAEGK